MIYSYPNDHTKQGNYWLISQHMMPINMYHHQGYTVTYYHTFILYYVEFKIKDVKEETY